MLVDAGHVAVAVSTAYYAMLYAARAALSERDRHACGIAGVHPAYDDHPLGEPDARGDLASFREAVAACGVTWNPQTTLSLSAARRSRASRSASS
jgi:hypothetical protein